MFSGDLEVNSFLVSMYFVEFKLLKRKMAKRISELFSRFFSVVVGDSLVGSQMGFHKPPAHVGSFVLLECRCYNPTGKMFF